MLDSMIIPHKDDLEHTRALGEAFEILESQRARKLTLEEDERNPSPNN